MKSKKIQELLNKHFKTNISLGNLYTKYYFMVAKTPYTNLAEYIKELATDKLGIHKDKIVDFMLSADYELNYLTQIESYDCKANMNIKDIVASMLKHEQDVINEVNTFAETALAEKDYQSFEFIQWFVRDGLKDCNEVKYIADLLNSSDDLLAIDDKIGSMSK